MRIQNLKRLSTAAAYLLVTGGIAAAIWFGRPLWQPTVDRTSTNESEPGPPLVASIDKPKILELNAQARSNLKLKVSQVNPRDYWRTLQIPGVIEDRPGQTDRGITAPLSGVITRVHALEGDIIQPGDRLFTIRLVSEYLQQSQSDLFKANREIEILNQEIQRIESLVASGSLPGKRKIELEQQISRQSAKVDAYRQDLASRGLSTQQVDQIQNGNFLSTIDVLAPEVSESDESNFTSMRKISHLNASAIKQDFFEIQNLKVELGQQVQAGEAPRGSGEPQFAVHQRACLQKGSIPSCESRRAGLESRS